MMALAALSAPAYAAEDDRPVTATLGGRLHLDFATFDNDNRGTPNKDDTEIRRAWLDVSGKFFVVDYKLEADFSGDRVEAKDVYLARSFGKAGKLTVGQFKQYFSLDDRTSSNYGSFLERGNAGTTLAPLYRLGASWQANPGDFTWAASIYSLESIDAWQVKGRAAGGGASPGRPRPATVTCCTWACRWPARPTTTRVPTACPACASARARPATCPTTAA